jgi:SAM-dependent methyltransferase
MTETQHNADGYFMDDIYVPVYNSSIDPRAISAYARFFGFASPPTDQPFVYGDFGCGLGTDIIMLACVMPHAQFYGFDINADQIAHARTLAARLNLSNVKFINAAFADITAKNIPPLDYAVNTGVISWVSKAVRGELIQAMSRCISDTGLAFVTYQVKPGANLESSFRYLLKALLNKGETPKDAFHTLSNSTPDAPKYDRDADEKTGNQLRYLKHEFISDHWNPVYPSEMISAFAEGNFGLIGPFDAPDGITKDLKALSSNIDDLFLLDFYACNSNKGGRSDIFSKQASLKDLNLKSHAQEPHIFRLPLPVDPSEKDEQRLSQDALSNSQKCQPLNKIFTQGISGPMRQLALTAYERKSSVLATQNPTPVNCPHMFEVIDGFVEDQFKLIDCASWKNRTIIVKNSSLILTCPKPIYNILSQMSGVPLSKWHKRLTAISSDELSTEEMTKLKLIWQHHWAPILAAHGVIKPVSSD